MDAVVSLLQQLVAKMPVVGVVLMALGALVVLAQVVVVLTPTKDDDAVVSKVKNMPIVGQLIALLESFAPLQKKPDGAGLSLSVAKK